MEKIKMEDTISLAQKFKFSYSGLAFDGKYFYFTCPDMSLTYVCNKSLKNIGVIRNTSKYSKICFDSNEGCFWCSIDKDFCTIYKLNYKFKQIDKIYIEPDFVSNREIKSLSFDSFTNKLLVGFSNCVVLVSKDNPNNNITLIKNYKSIITSVISIAPTFVVTYLNGNKQTLEVYDNNTKVIDSYEIDENVIVQAGIFDPCEDFFNNQFKFYFLSLGSNSKQNVSKWIYKSSNKCMFVDFSNYNISNNSSATKCELVRNGDNLNCFENLVYIENSLDEVIDYQNQLRFCFESTNSEISNKENKYISNSINKLNELKNNLKNINT